MAEVFRQQGFGGNVSWFGSFGEGRGTGKELLAMVSVASTGPSHRHLPWRISAIA